MTNDNDMIRRGDVLAVVESYIGGDYAADEIRGLPAIDAQPDPRDEVIARLVEALEDARESILSLLKGQASEVEGPKSDWTDDIDAALAAVKGEAK